MIALYFCKTEKRRQLLPEILRAEYGAPVQIIYGEGKPRAENGEIFFNLSPSGGLCVIAVSPINVGVDTELLQTKHYNSILASLPAEEQREIAGDRSFFMHWTAREAYAKLRGIPIFALHRRLMYASGSMRLDGKTVPEKIAFCFERGAVTAVCAENTDFVIKTFHE